PLVLRSASSPATLGSPTWAGALAQQTINDQIAAIADLFAAADVLGRGTQVSFDGAGTVRFPGRAVAAVDAGNWLGEGSPIPVRQQQFTNGLVLAPRKVAVIVVMTREMAESSNLEAIAKALISEALGIALDVAFLSTAVDDGVKPGGILAGVTPITPTAGGDAK